MSFVVGLVVGVVGDDGRVEGLGTDWETDEGLCRGCEIEGFQGIIIGSTTGSSSTLVNK